MDEIGASQNYLEHFDSPEIVESPLELSTTMFDSRQLRIFREAVDAGLYLLIGYKAKPCPVIHLRLNTKDKSSGRGPFALQSS